MLDNYGKVCEPFVPDYTVYDLCISQIDYQEFNSELNTKLEAYLRNQGVSESYVYQSFDNNTEYCDIMFADES